MKLIPFVHLSSLVVVKWSRKVCSVRSMVCLFSTANALFNMVNGLFNKANVLFNVVNSLFAKECPIRKQFELLYISCMYDSAKY